MPQTSRSSRRSADGAAGKADDVRSGAQETAEDAQGTAEDTTAEATEGTGGGEESRGGDSRETFAGELKDTVRQAAIDVLKPVLRDATKSAAKYAVTEGPSLVKDRVAPKLEEAGGAGALVKGVASKGGDVAGGVGGLASKLGGGGKKQEGESPSGTGRGRRLPVQEFVDVGVDLETAYDQFTQFEEWPKFMHRVERIEQRDDTTLMWHENIWGVRRSWEAEITDQTPCERIAWRSKGGPQVVGAATFHRLSDRLTRVYVTMDFQPKGLFEKTASGTRISRRALSSDLMRFKAYLEMSDEATGAWRGQIEEGEVVDQPDDEAQEEGRDEEEEPTAEEGEEQPSAEDEGDEDDEESYEDEEEEEEAPRARRGKKDDEDSASDDEDEEAEAPRARRRGKQDDEGTAASADEDEDQDEAEEEPARPPRTSRSAPQRRRRAPASTRGRR